ncbi:MAG: hypothetical protein LBN34_04945 [Clostridiales Family XIII bacterium]|jgi:hypothetical protein|nr:hypothetical protein [Clostridiales Family XIII bacterium]
MSKGRQLKPSELEKLLKKGKITQSTFDSYYSLSLSVQQQIYEETWTKGDTARTIFILIFIIAIIVLVIDSCSTSDNYDDMTPEAWLEFDAKSWEDYKALYQTHNNLINHAEAFGNGQISILEFYNKCKEFKSWFGNASLSYSYGENKVERDYLDLYKSVAIADGQGVQYIIESVDSNKFSDASEANERISTAKDFMGLIILSRYALLKKAGLTEEEITAKVDSESAALDAA